MHISSTRNLILSLLIILILLTSCAELASPPLITPSPTQQSTLSPLITPSPTAVIETTPEGETRLADTDLILSFGDYAEAMRQYQKTSNLADEELKAAAQFGIGLTYYKQKDLFQAKKSLLELVSRYPDSIPAKRANFVLALISMDQELEEDALTYYQAYRDSRPGMLDAEVNLRIADLLSESGQTESALEAYRAAYLAPQLTTNTEAALKLASTYQELGQDDLALGIYKEILYNTSSDYTKAQMNLLIAWILIDQQQTDEAYTYLQDSVNNYPFTYDAYIALVTLIDADQTVDEVKRGIINYNMEQYTLAIEAFDRYLTDDGFAKDEALYYKALSLRAEGLVQAGFSSEERMTANAAGGMEQDKEAIELWNELINTYPQSNYRFDAIEDIIYTQNVYMGQMKLAIGTIEDFIAAPYSQPDAPDLLQIAANYYLLDGQVRGAADSWTRIGLEFPSSTNAFNGLFFGGSLYFELGELEKAAENFNRAVLLASPETLEVAASYFWLGKVSQAQGDKEKANSYWQVAFDSDPHGYYGIRSMELMTNQEPFTALPNYDFEIDLEEERLVAGEWLKTAFSLPSGINLDYSSELANDKRFLRGEEYHRLGLYNLASQEFESLRLSWKDDPLNCFRLMKVFLDLGYYQSAIETSRSISRLAGYGDIPISVNFPPYFAHVQYGTYYLPWIEAAAEKYKLPVILIYSLIYQESRFAAHAYSSAGASGLMQLMPATAAQIASETGYPPNYSQTDLAVPSYNLELGTNYLARQLYVFEGDYYHALAAYNAGPGNTLQWKEITGEDADVFLNSISYLETRTYLRRLVEIFHLYTIIYGN